MTNFGSDRTRTRVARIWVVPLLAEDEEMVGNFVELLGQQ
jgi:hypothetical protein